MWAKISTSATAIACAACLAAAAATLPAVEKAGSDLARTADVKLAVDLSRLAAFDAIPAYIAFLTSGDPDELGGVDGVNLLTTLFGDNGVFGSEGNGIDALLPDDDADPAQPGYALLSALPVFVGSEGLLTTGNVDALADYDALSAIPAVLSGDLSSLDSVSAIPPYIELAGGDITATGDLDSLSAVDTFFGDSNGESGGGVFTGGGIDALAPNADDEGGYAALSALPVFFGTAGPFGPGVFNGGGLSALSNYDALSAIPAYLDLPDNEPVPVPATADPLALRTTSTGAAPGGTGTQSLPSFAPQVQQQVQQQVQPQVELPKVDPAATPGGNSGPQLNVARVSEKFTPDSIGKSPILFGTGTPGVDNGIRGWGEGLKKLGIGGADAPSGTDADGGE